MKLRNKQTGEIIDVFPHKHSLLTQFNSLAELNEEWEDYEEPKEYWYIEDIDGVAFMDADLGERYNKFRKSIGNYFETKEEAEKAVEKLKAWKRLKDKGFRFEGGDDACISYKTDMENWSMQDLQDFKTLFGGEE